MGGGGEAVDIEVYHLDIQGRDRESKRNYRGYRGRRVGIRGLVMEEVSRWIRLETHASHATHTTHAAHGWRSFLLWSLNDGNLSGTEKRRNTAGVNKSGAHDLERIKNTSGDHVHILALGAVETLVEVLAELIHELADNDGALSAGVLDNGPGWAGDGILNDGHTKLLVEVDGLNVVQSVSSGLKETSSSTRQNTLLDSSAGGVKSIDNPILLLANLNLGRTADLDDGNTSGQLGQTLLELLLLVLGSGRIGDDTANLLASLSNSTLAALAVENNGVLLGDGDGAGGAEHVGRSLLELDVQLIGEDGTVGEDRDIAKNGLSIVTKAGSLDGGNLELATELIENADSESLTIDILSNDDEGSAELLGSLKSGDDVLDGGDFLFREKNQGLFELDLLGLGVGDEVGRDETTVKLHAFSNLKLILGGLALLDGNDTLLSDLLHGAGEELSNMGIAVGGDGSNLSNFLAGSNITLVRPQIIDNSLNSSLGPSPQIHGIAAGGDVLHGLGEDCPGEDGGSGGTITSSLVGLGSHILEKTGTEVLELVLESNGLCDGHTVWTRSVWSRKPRNEDRRTLCDLGRAEAGLDQHISALGTQCG